MCVQRLWGELLRRSREDRRRLELTRPGLRRHNLVAATSLDSLCLQPGPRLVRDLDLAWLTQTLLPDGADLCSLYSSQLSIVAVSRGFSGLWPGSWHPDCVGTRAQVPPAVPPGRRMCSLLAQCGFRVLESPNGLGRLRLQPSIAIALCPANQDLHANRTLVRRALSSGSGEGRVRSSPRSL